MARRGLGKNEKGSLRKWYLRYVLRNHQAQDMHWANDRSGDPKVGRNMASHSWRCQEFLGVVQILSCDFPNLLPSCGVQKRIDLGSEASDLQSVVSLNVQGWHISWILGAVSVCLKRKGYGTKSAMSRPRAQVLDGRCASFGALCIAEPHGHAAPRAGFSLRDYLTSPPAALHCPSSFNSVSRPRGQKFEFVKLFLQVFRSVVAT